MEKNVQVLRQQEQKVKGHKERLQDKKEETHKQVKSGNKALEQAKKVVPVTQPVSKVPSTQTLEKVPVKAEQPAQKPEVKALPVKNTQVHQEMTQKTKAKTDKKEAIKKDEKVDYTSLQTKNLKKFVDQEKTKKEKSIKDFKKKMEAKNKAAKA